METSEAIETRRSVHSYADEDVKRDEIRGVLEEARWSPSSYNLQPWEFVVVDDDEGQEELHDAAYGQGIHAGRTHGRTHRTDGR